MKIAVLGTGMVGQAIAGRLHELDHDVVVGTRDVAETVGRQATGLGSAVLTAEAHGRNEIRVAAFADAARHGDVIINATGGAVAVEVLQAAGADNLDGKVLIDVSNPLEFGEDSLPTLFVRDTDSLGERIQRAFPGAKVVKTLNTVNADLMVRPSTLGEPTSVFVSGDDSDAKATVIALLTSLGHSDVIDLGDISTARGPEMWLPLWLRLMESLGTSAFNIKVVR